MAWFVCVITITIIASYLLLHLKNGQIARESDNHMRKNRYYNVTIQISLVNFNAKAFNVNDDYT